MFAQKPAPISLTWLGFGYTTGLSAIDYFLTDNVMVPNGSEHLFSEKPWRLKKIIVFAVIKQKRHGRINKLPALQKDLLLLEPSPVLLELMIG